MIKSRLYQTLFELNATPVIAKRLRAFAESPASRTFIPSFAKTYQINLDEAAEPIEAYPSLHAFFTRHLKDGVRPIDASLDSIVSPCDGKLSIVGDITDDSRFEVKGQSYTLAELLGSQQEARRYAGGTVCVLYLSPRDYHRVHVPLAGRVLSHYELGDRSAPVNDIGLTETVRPLSRNYRRVTRFETAAGLYEHIMVGALNVNTIEWTLNGDRASKGEEVGYFSFGSTVILCFEKGRVTIDPTKIGPVRLGEVIGTMQND
ncbi:phosphatidylserine decarboxylase [Exiguobacterium aurantiacum]|uniref:Phosphatidylserine decarboxylase proenzyme n=1 Tax=Exiguobacterium aurantiacum TaxID=33987 RepID=A0ABY5FL27_9BACL|nr:phosphatidylserine decarboxylase [Exiguobacterium aurantiacum]UTT42181.1 phosphatidylserine decarboxylase [Exiguobacterium aurantiacum]